MENQVQQKTFNAVSKVPSVIELKDKLLPLAKQFSTEIANLRTDEENRRLLMTFIFKLADTKDKNQVSVLRTCSQESIQECAYRILLDGYDLSKNQASLIPYGSKLTVQPEYFGNVSRLYDKYKISIRGCVIHKDDKVTITINEKGIRLIKHETCWENFSKPIVGAWASAWDEKGELVDTDIMTMVDIQKSWLQGRNGTSVHNKFPNEMSRKTVESRLAKHLYNKRAGINELTAEELEESFEETEQRKNVEAVDVNFESVETPKEETTSTQPIQEEETQQYQSYEPNYEQPTFDSVDTSYDESFDNQGTVNDFFGTPSEQEETVQQTPTPVVEEGGIIDMSNATAQEIVQMNFPINTILIVKYSVYKALTSEMGLGFSIVASTYNAAKKTTQIKKTA